MAILEDVTVGASVSGIAGNSSAVQIVAVKWHGPNALTVITSAAKDRKAKGGGRILKRQMDDAVICA